MDLLSFFDLTLCSHVLQMSSGQKVINAMTLSIGDGANDAYDEQNIEVSLVFFSVIHLDSLCIYCRCIRAGLGPKAQGWAWA